MSTTDFSQCVCAPVVFWVLSSVTCLSFLLLCGTEPRLSAVCHVRSWMRYSGQYFSPQSPICLRQLMFHTVNSTLCFEVGRRPDGAGVGDQSGPRGGHQRHQEAPSQMDRGHRRGKTPLTPLGSPAPDGLKTRRSASQIQYEITRVRQKMKELASLHDKHMNRPTLDDSSEEEHAIEITTQEITQVDLCSITLLFCFLRKRTSPAPRAVTVT